MKKILILLACVVLLTSCDKKENATAKYPRVYITGVERENGNKTTELYDRHSVDYVLSHDSVSVYFYSEEGEGGMWFAVENNNTSCVGTIDRANKRLAVDMFYFEDKDRFAWLNFFFRSDYCAVVKTIKNDSDVHGDTIAYIPSDNIKQFKVALDKYAEEGLTPELEQIFETALQFYPCTGAEYLATDDYAALDYWLTNVRPWIHWEDGR